MSHEEQRDRLLDLAYGELPPQDARALEEHAETCEACRVELGRIRATRGLMSSLPVEAAPAARERILVAAAREAVRRREPRRAFPRWLWGGSVLAASVAAVVLFSLRLANVAPPPAGREDPNALLGDSPYARPPAPAPEPPASAPADAAAPPGRAGAPQERLAESAPKRPERRHALRQESRPEPEERRAAPRAERAFATPPPPAPPPAAATDAGARDESRIAAAPPGPTPDASAARIGTLQAPSAAPAAPARRAPDGRAAAKAEAPPASREDAPRAAGAAALSRRDELRAAGRLRVEVREFPGCDAELLRRIERDPAGAIVGYSWEARVGERRVRYEVVYADDGSPLRARAVDAVTGEPQRGSFRAPSAGELDLAAPSRCAR